MSITLPLDQMTKAEKLRVMEELWGDLTQDEQEFESPAWHEPILKEREDRLRAGEETPIDWEVAKKELRKRLTCERVDLIELGGNWQSLLRFDL